VFLHVLVQADDAVEDRVVAPAGQQLEFGRFPQLDVRGIIAKGEGDGFAEIAVEGLPIRPARG